MRIDLEKSQKIRNLSNLLCFGAIMLSVVYVHSKVFLYMGIPANEFLVSIYTLLPPSGIPIPPEIQSVLPMMPLKDLIYGIILGMLFLFFGYFRIKMRWLFHFIIAFLGYCSVLFFYSINPAFWVSDLIVILFFILVTVTGIFIYKNSEKKNS